MRCDVPLTPEILQEYSWSSQSRTLLVAFIIGVVWRSSANGTCAGSLERSLDWTHPIYRRLQVPEGHLDQGIIVATNTILTLDWALYIRVFPRDFFSSLLMSLGCK